MTDLTTKPGNATVVRRRPSANIAGAERLGRVLGGATGVIAMLLMYFPVVWLALMSVSELPLGGVPSLPTLKWYAELFERTGWVVPLLSSMGLGLAVGLSCAVAALILARALPAMRRGRYLLMMFLLPLFVPGLLVGVSMFIWLRVFLGLKLGWWSIFLGHFTWAYPFALLALLVTTLRFDNRLMEAAADLGASPWRRFVDIEFPIILPGVVAAGLFGFLLSFNELSRSILLRGQVETLPLFDWVQASAHQSNVPVLFGLSTLIMLVSTGLIGFAFYLMFGRSRD